MTLAVIVVTAGACSSIGDLPAYKNPAYMDKTYASVAVLLDTTALDWRREFEGTLVQELEERGTRGIASGHLVFPGEPYDSTKLHEAIARSGAEALLELVVDRTDLRTRHHPRQIITMHRTTRTEHSESEEETESSKDETESESNESEKESGDIVWVAYIRQNGPFTSDVDWISEMIAHQLRNDKVTD